MEEIKSVTASQIFPAHWLPLSHELREYIAKEFGIQRSVSTEIVDNRIVSDGRSVRDLQIITTEAMQKYLNDSKEKDFYRLWELTVSKAQYEMNTPIEIKIPVVDKPVETVDKPKKTGLETASPSVVELANKLMDNGNANESKKK